MKRVRTGLYPAGRLQVGAAILAAAAAVDITLVRRRFLAFGRAQRRYQRAYDEVEALAAELHTRQAAAAACDAQEDEAVEKLAAALAVDGEPRRSPFAGLGLDAPSDIEALKYGEKAKAVHELAAAVLRRPNSSAATRRAAKAAAEAADATQQALQPVEKLQARLDAARAVRERYGQSWDQAMLAFKHDVRAAAADGAPGLDTALFGRTRAKPTPNGKPVTKQRGTTQAATPTTDRQPAPTAETPTAVTPASTAPATGST